MADNPAGSLRGAGTAIPVALSAPARFVLEWAGRKLLRLGWLGCAEQLRVQVQHQAAIKCGGFLWATQRMEGKRWVSKVGELGARL